MLRYLRALLVFARFQAWVDTEGWGPEEAAQLANFNKTPTGVKLNAKLRNMFLQQQANALSRTDQLAFEAGYCNGQKGVLAVLDSLADPANFTSEEAGPDPDSN